MKPFPAVGFFHKLMYGGMNYIQKQQSKQCTNYQESMKVDGMNYFSPRDGEQHYVVLGFVYNGIFDV